MRASKARGGDGMAGSGVGAGRSRAVAAAGMGAAFSVLSASASAFDYPEHAHISHHAIVLATTGCDDANDPSCAGARELADALRAELHEPLLCTAPETIGADQPQGCLTLGDIPALTGDHAGSPLLTRWRWLDGSLRSPPQALIPALAGVVAMFDTSSRSPETERQHVPDRSGFVQYIRNYAPARWPLTEGPSDLQLEIYDSNYIGLAERGHPHFRPRLAAPNARIQVADGRWVYLAALRYLSTYPQYDRHRLRSKPDNNAFAWYADQHLGALRMAHAASHASPADRPLLLATAMFLELNAWHYLEDSVAAGHMIGDANSPRGALNNGALTATHNEYCAGLPGQNPPRRVDIEVPQDLCNLVAERHWQGQLPQLAAVCADPSKRRQSIYGDHVIAESGVVCGDLVRPWDGDPRAFDALMTENWAAVLAAESYEEVVRASAGEGFGIPADDALTDCGREDHWTKDPAYTWGYDPKQVRLYQCLFAWWEGDHDNQHGNAISSLLPGPAFRAMSLVPIPEPAGDRKRYPQETFFSGNSVSVSAFGYGYSHSMSSRAVVRGGVDLEYLIVAPRTLLPIQIAIGGTFETAFESPPEQRLGLDLTARYDYAPFSKWYFGASGQAGYVLGAKTWDAAGDLIPLGVTFWDKNSILSNLELRGGYDAYFGWRAGLAASLGFL